jgi:hypothetical protein
MSMLLLNELGDDMGDYRMGVLVMHNVGSYCRRDKLTKAREALEQTLRETYAATPRAELKALHPMDVYVAYYKKYRDCHGRDSLSIRE